MAFGFAGFNTRPLLERLAAITVAGYAANGMLIMVSPVFSPLGAIMNRKPFGQLMPPPPLRTKLPPNISTELQPPCRSMPQPAFRLELVPYIIMLDTTPP